MSEIISQSEILPEDVVTEKLISPNRRTKVLRDSVIRLGGTAVGGYNTVKSKGDINKYQETVQRIDGKMRKIMNARRDKRYQHVIERQPELKLAFKEAYSKAGYWHGTGRYHYKEDGTREDVLAGILQNGLRANVDPADPYGVTSTASVAPSRMLSRVYASTHYERGKKLDNAYGSFAFWGGVFSGGNVPDILGDKDTRRQMFSPSHIRTLLAWNAKRTQERGTGTFTFGLGSDIKDNYPILIGIKDDVYDVAHTSAYTARSERRIIGGVQTSSFTHLEVPFENIEETKAVLAENGYDELPVLPLEIGEEYASQFPFSQLASGQKLVQEQTHI